MTTLSSATSAQVGDRFTPTYFNSKLDPIYANVVALSNSFASSNISGNRAVVNVLAFGGPFTGIEGYDSTPAILAAQAYAGSGTTALPIYFPPGIYGTTSDITFNNHFNVYGEPGASIIRPGIGVNVGITLTNPGWQSTVYGITVQGVDAPTKTGWKIGSAGSISNPMLTACRALAFNGAGGIGFLLADEVGTVMQDCAAFTSDTNIKVLGSAYDVPTLTVFRDLFCSNSVGTGMDIRAGRALLIDRGDFESNAGPAISLSPTTISGNAVPVSRLLFRECWFEANQNSSVSSYAVILDGTGTGREVDAEFLNCHHGATGLFLSSNSVRRLVLDNTDFETHPQTANIKIGGANTVVDVRRWSTVRDGAISSTFTTFNSATTLANLFVEEVTAGVKAHYGVTSFAGLRSNLTTVIGNYTATVVDQTISVNSSSVVTVTLPTPSTVTGQVYDIKRMGAGVVKIISASSASFDGQALLSINNQYDGTQVQSYGSGYLLRNLGNTAGLL